jgi:hypothetical protein
MSFRPLAILNRFDGGAVTRDFPDNIPKNCSPYPKNVELYGSTVRKARGFTKYGTESSSSDIGFTLYNHRILSDTELLIKTIGTTVKFLDPVSNNWYPITTATLTAGKRWWFTSFNGYLYGCNGTDNFCRWRGSAYSTLKNAVSNGATTIDLATGTGARFPTSGTGLIEGDAFTWTGKTGDQLTGVSGIQDHPAGATVIMAMDTTTYTTQPKGSVGLYFGFRMFTRDDANPNFWYFSKLADNTTPEDDLTDFTMAGSGSGDAGYIIMPAAVVGAEVFITGGNDAVQVVFCSDGVAYAVSVTDSGSITSGAAVPFKVLGADLAGKNMTAITENDLLALDNTGCLRALGYGEQSTTLKTARLSDDIAPTMENVDWADGAMFYHKRKIYMLGKVNGSSVNNYCVVRDTNPTGYVFWEHWCFNDLCEHENELYGLSSVNGNVYKLNNGLSADGGAIASSYPLPDLDFDAPLIFKEAAWMRVGGYMTANCHLYIKVYLDNSITPYTFLLSGDNTDIVSANDNVAIGTVIFGTGVVGGGLPSGSSLREFEATLNFPTLGYFNKLRIVFENNESDVDFYLDKLLVWAEAQDPFVTFDKLNLQAI